MEESNLKKCIARAKLNFSYVSEYHIKNKIIHILFIELLSIKIGANIKRYLNIIIIVLQ